MVSEYQLQTERFPEAKSYGGPVFPYLPSARRPGSRACASPLLLPNRVRGEHSALVLLNFVFFYSVLSFSLFYFCVPEPMWGQCSGGRGGEKENTNNLICIKLKKDFIRLIFSI